MDASSLASAALAVAIEDSRADAVRELMLDRERAAMLAEDRGSFLIERSYGVGRLPRNEASNLEVTFDRMRAIQRDAVDSVRAAHNAIGAAMTAIDRRLNQPTRVAGDATIRLEDEPLQGEEAAERATRRERSRSPRH